MKIYPVKPHKRTALDSFSQPIQLNIPESNFIIKNYQIYYGVIRHDCLISTNLSLFLNCGSWKIGIKNDQDLINKFWNSNFPIVCPGSSSNKPRYNVFLYPINGLIPLKYDFDEFKLAEFLKLNLDKSFNALFEMYVKKLMIVDKILDNKTCEKLLKVIWELYK